MFGLEKEKNKAQKFQFDLELEIEENPEKAQEILDRSKKQIDQIKSLLKKGADPKDFDSLGVLIHGYNALSRVIKKAQKKR